MIGNILAAGCLFTLNIFILVFAASLRMLPSLMVFLRQAVRTIMDYSIRFYKLILARVAPLVERFLGINIFNGFARIFSTVLISMIIGLVLFFITPIPINGLTFIICVIHGLVVGIAWEGNSNHDGLNLGDHLE